MTSKHQCQYCDNTFATASSLNRHIRTSQTCIKTRDGYTDEIICDGCKKEFVTQKRLESHTILCDKYIHKKELSMLKKEHSRHILLLEEEISMLKKLVEKAIDKPTTTVNKCINNISIRQHITRMNKPISHKFLTNTLSKLTPEHVYAGAEGLALYVKTNQLEDVLMICTDKSRKIFVYSYKDDNDKISLRIDPNLVKFNPEFFQIIEEMACILLRKKIDELKIGMENDIKEAKKIAGESATKYTDMEIDIKQSARGQSTPLSNKFVAILTNHCYLSKYDIPMLDELEILEIPDVPLITEIN
jgi:hypothetical protein